MSLEEALNPNTPADRLQEILDLENKEICQALATNPNSPPELLIELFYEYPLEVLNNPVLELILLEIPDFFDRLYNINLDILYEKYLPLLFIEWAINHSDSEIRKKIIKSNAIIPEVYLEKLAKDEEHFIRYFLANNDKTPGYILERLAEDKNNEVRSSVAKNPNTLKTSLEKLAEDERENVRIEVVKNKNTPIHILEKLAGDRNNIVRYCIAENKNTPIHVLEKLADDRNDNIRSYVAENENTPIHILAKLGLDKSVKVRIAVIKNPNTDRTTIEQIFEDKNYLPFDPNDCYAWEIRDAIELEIMALNWTEKQKRQYLWQTYQQDSLNDLNKEELLEFWQYLRSLK